MPSWSELVSIVLPVAFGLGMVFLKTKRRKVAKDGSAINDKVVTTALR
jgi:hypothetical protein